MIAAKSLRDTKTLPDKAAHLQCRVTLARHMFALRLLMHAGHAVPGNGAGPEPV
jgi:hypothetical protein